MGGFSKIACGGQREESLGEITFVRRVGVFNRAAEERKCVWEYHLKSAEVMGVFAGYVPTVWIATEIGLTVMEGLSLTLTKTMAITLLVSAQLVGGAGASCGYRLANRVFQWLKPPPPSV